MKKLSITFIYLGIMVLMLDAAKASAFQYTADTTPYAVLSALTNDSNRLGSHINEPSLYTFDLLSFLKIEQSDFGSLQMFNGKVYIRDGVTYKIYQLDPHTGQYTRSVSGDNLGDEIASLLNQMFSPQENNQVLEKIKISYTELILMALNLMVIVVWLPTAYICIL